MRIPLAGILLILQFVVVTVGLFVSGRFHAELVPDSPSYLEFPFESLRASLGSFRTPGYPSFIKLVTCVFGSYEAVPVVQYMIYCGAVLVFYRGLVRIGAVPIVASLTAGSLLTTNILWLYVPTIATDTLAAAAGIASVGLALQMSRADDRGLGILTGIAASTTAAWLIRPAYLFLVPVIVIVSVIVQRRSQVGRHFAFKDVIFPVIKSSLLVGFPLFSWCMLRFCVVDSFGVCSFGGYNLIGIAGQLLDTGQIDRLPLDLKPLAEKAVVRRSELPSEAFQMVDAGRLNYMRIEVNYDLTIWKIFKPAANDLYGDDDRIVNKQLARLGTAIIRETPFSYAVWLTKATRQGALKIVSDIVVNPVGLAMILAGLTIRVVLLTFRWFGSIEVKCFGETPVIDILFVTSLCYAIFCLGLTICVCPPLGRLTDAASVLLTPLLATMVLQQFNIMTNHPSKMTGAR